MDTSALNPQFLALYNAQLPQVLLAAQQQMQAKGLFNSGNAADAATKAQADLMASLLAQQQAQVQQTSINQANINQQNNAQANQIAASNRQTNMGLIGTGAGVVGTLGGMALMNKYGIGGLGGGMKNTMMVNGQPVTVNSDGTYTPMTPTGAGGSVIPNNGVGGLAPSSNSFDAAGGAGGPPSDVMGGAAPASPAGGNIFGGGSSPMASYQPGGLPASGFASSGVTPNLDSLAGVGPSALDAASASMPAMSGGMTSFADNAAAALPGGMTSFADNAAAGMAGGMSSLADSSGGAASGLFASFAKGGIVSKPTLATIGDAGPGNPEEVIPLNKLQAAVGPSTAARVMAAVPQPGNPGFGQPPGNPGMSPGVAAPPPPGMPPAPMPSMWSQPSPGGPVPPQPAPQPLNALQRGGLLGNLFKPS